MPILRLAYTTQFLIALIAIFVLWGQVGGQSHLELLPWFIKLALGAATAYATVRATSAAVSGERGWNGQSVRWVGVALVLACLCGVASYYAHMYLEDDQEADPQQETTVSRIEAPAPASQSAGEHVRVRMISLTEAMFGGVGNRLTSVSQRRVRILVWSGRPFPRYGIFL